MLGVWKLAEVKNIKQQKALSWFHKLQMNNLNSYNYKVKDVQKKKKNDKLGKENFSKCGGFYK